MKGMELFRWCRCVRGGGGKAVPDCPVTGLLMTAYIDRIISVTVFYEMTPYFLVKVYWHFSGRRYFYLHHTSVSICRWTCTRLYGIISHKRIIFTVAATRISDDITTVQLMGTHEIASVKGERSNFGALCDCRCGSQKRRVLFVWLHYKSEHILETTELRFLKNSRINFLPRKFISHISVLLH